jgi:AcrR family transcriptional regulator
MRTGTSVSVTHSLNGSERVRNSALSLFASKGYQNVSLRLIAAQAGMLAGSLYHHVESKQQLLHELIEDHLSASLFALGACMASADTPAAKLKRYIQTYIRFEQANPEGALVARHEWRSLGPDYLAAASALRDRQLSLLASILKGVQGEGAGADSQAAACVVMGLLESVPDLLVRHPPGPPLTATLALIEATAMQAFLPD